VLDYVKILLFLILFLFIRYTRHAVGVLRKYDMELVANLLLSATVKSYDEYGVARFY